MRAKVISKARQDVRERLGLQLVQAADLVAERIEGLLVIPVSDRELKRWLDLAVPLQEFKESTDKRANRGFMLAEKRREGMEALWQHDPKVKPWANTAFGVLQLDNTWRTFEGTVRGMQGGRMELNYTQDVQGKAAAADELALDKLAEATASWGTPQPGSPRLPPRTASSL